MKKMKFFDDEKWRRCGPNKVREKGNKKWNQAWKEKEKKEKGKKQYEKKGEKEREWETSRKDKNKLKNCWEKGSAYKHIAPIDMWIFLPSHSYDERPPFQQSGSPLEDTLTLIMEGMNMGDNKIKCKGD